jgi:hypothetical protein
LVEYGRRTWFFPDGDRPPAGDSPLKGHESIVILNPNERDAECRFTFYFEDKEPAADISVVVKANRVRCVQTHRESDFKEHTISVSTQYALKVQSDVPVIVQYGRLDARQANLAYYTVMGYATD